MATSDTVVDNQIVPGGTPARYNKDNLGGNSAQSVGGENPVTALFHSLFASLGLAGQANPIDQTQAGPTGVTPAGVMMPPGAAPLPNQPNAPSYPSPLNGGTTTPPPPGMADIGGDNQSPTTPNPGLANMMAALGNEGATSPTVPTTIAEALGGPPDQTVAKTPPAANPTNKAGKSGKVGSSKGKTKSGGSRTAKAGTVGMSKMMASLIDTD